MSDLKNVSRGLPNRQLEKTVDQIWKTMKAGYEEMGPLNVSLSEEWLPEETSFLIEYEKRLAESE